MKADKKTISRQQHELRDSANYLGCHRWEVLRAIEELQSNDRAEVYEYIRKQKEGVIHVDLSQINDVDPEQVAQKFRDAINQQSWTFSKTPMRNKQNVLNWAKDKGILDKATPMSQALKTLEEVHELLTAINNNNLEECTDAFGDILVTIIIGAKLSGLDIEDCLDSAYNVIKGRTGQMVNGTFVKDEA